MGFTKTITAATLALGLAATAGHAEELKFASFFASTHPYTAGTFQPFADKVKEYSNGDVTVDLFTGGELGSGPVEQYSRALEGVADLAVSLPGYTASTFPTTLLAELPGVLNEDTGTQTLWDNIDLFKSEYRRVQLVSLWSSAKNYIFSRDKPVRTLDDVKGMKIRVPSRNTGRMVEAWGATPVSMPVSDIYNSLQTGVIDAAMIDGTGVNAFKLGEVANYLTIGIDSTNSPFFIVMNRDAFRSLSKEDQAAVLKAGKEASLLGQKTQLTVAAAGIKEFGEMPGHEVITPDPEALAAFNKASDSIVPVVVKEEEAKGIKAQAVIDALKGGE